MKIDGLAGDEDFTFEDIKIDTDAVRLHIITRLREWKGDCFFDKDAGIDYLNRLNDIGNLKNLEGEIRSVIVKTKGVQELVNLEVNFFDRIITVLFEVKDVYDSYINDVATLYKSGF